MRHPEYSVHPAVEYGRAIVANLPDRTGSSIDEWMERIESAGLDDRRAVVEWLRSDCGIGGTTANLIARVATEGRASIEAEAYLASAPGLVEALYAGPRAALVPLHEAVVGAFLALGPDVRFAPTKTLVPVYRNHVIAHVWPATRTRIDVGLALGADASGERLVDTGGAAKGDRITHRLPVHTADDLDGTFTTWIRRAYDRDAD